MPEELRILHPPPVRREYAATSRLARLYGQMRRQRYLDNRKVLFGGFARKAAASRQSTALQRLRLCNI
jgi:hypothetical protein